MTPPYPPEFRAEAVRLVRSSGEPLPKIARELGVSAQTLRNWVFQAGVDAGQGEGLKTDERARLRGVPRTGFGDASGSALGSEFAIEPNGRGNSNSTRLP